MKIAAVIPTRGDKKKFSDFARYQMERQTVKPDFIITVNGMPKDDSVDLVERYRKGFDQSKELGADLIFCIEDDDFYSNDYIARMIDAWDQNGQPDLFGFDKTIYYHIFLKKYRVFNHPGRASMFNTMITKDLKINWPPDSERFLDIHLWKEPVKKLSVDFNDFSGLPCIGIKHGLGKCAGGGHKKLMFVGHKDGIDDPEYKFFKQKTGTDFEFYEGIVKENAAHRIS